jgi:phosphoglycerol transferase MdoB-like AlkP superfamily enzyme/creatinine amidohydrolase/Fe(II)-dependent formamide hydrolase-like protein
VSQRRLLARYGPVVPVIAMFLAISLVTRLALLVLHAAPAHDGIGPTLHALGRGEVFDTLAVLWLIAPAMLYLTFVPDRWRNARSHRWLTWGWWGASLFGMLFIAAAEYAFFEEFDGRFNFVAVDYLMYPTEVTVNLWQSYPLGRDLALILVASIALLLLLRRPLSGLHAGETPWRGRAALLAGYTGVLVGSSFGVPPALARLSEDRALNEIAGNGYIAFYNALRGEDAPYAGLYAERPLADVFDRLGKLLHTADVVPGSMRSGTAWRWVAPAGPARRLNVVVVLEESLGSEFIGALGDTLGISPYFDSLASRGMLFTNAYSTGNRTIRALETTTASIPPLPGISIVRRPDSRDLFTLPALLRERGYQTAFVYGGRALFDGMGAYMRNNGIDRIVEQKDFPDTAFRTAWGVADEAIFDRALQELDALHAGGSPFYALILSVSNHKPYTFPETGVTRDPQLDGRHNAVRYADYALGRFMREARDHAFFDNTLFVLMGDHGARVYGAAQIPLPSYQVPILFYSPRLLPAGVRIGTLMSSMDVAPTILGILGEPYPSSFFGHDVLRIAPSEGRALMTHNNDLALLRDSTMAVLGLHGTSALYRVDVVTGAARPIHQPSVAGQRLIDDAIAYYQGADQLYRAGSLRRSATTVTGTGDAGEDAEAGADPRRDTVRPTGGSISFDTSPGATEPEVEFERMTWAEVQQALRAGRKTALFYTGGTEQRGPQNANGGHNLMAAATVRAIAQELGDALAMPVLPYSPNNASSALPGTIGLTDSLLDALLERFAEQAIATGFTRVVLMGDHGGGQPDVYRNVARRLDARYASRGIRVIYCDDVYFKAQTEVDRWLKEHGYVAGTHGGIADTSEMLYLGGDEWVRRDLLPTAVGNGSNGITGDARGASAEIGRMIFELKVDLAVRQIRELLPPAP